MTGVKFHEVLVLNLCYFNFLYSICFHIYIDYISIYTSTKTDVKHKNFNKIYLSNFKKMCWSPSNLLQTCMYHVKQIQPKQISFGRKYIQTKGYYLSINNSLLDIKWVYESSCKLLWSKRQVVQTPFNLCIETLLCVKPCVHLALTEHKRKNYQILHENASSCLLN